MSDEARGKPEKEGDLGKQGEKDRIETIKRNVCCHAGRGIECGIRRKISTMDQPLCNPNKKKDARHCQQRKKGKSRNYPVLNSHTKKDTIEGDSNSRRGPATSGTRRLKGIKGVHDGCTGTKISQTCQFPKKSVQKSDEETIVKHQMGSIEKSRKKVGRER